MLTIETDNNNTKVIFAPKLSPTGPSSRLYLWKQRTFYLGPLMEPIRFSQGAASFAVSLGGEIHFSGKNISNKTTCKSMLIPPGTELECDTGNEPVAICMLDALRCDYRSLLSRTRQQVNSVAFDIENEDKYIENFTRHYYDEKPASEIFTCLETLVGSCQHDNNAYPIDSRIAKVIELIQANISDNLSIDTLAECVELSVPRLVQLFRMQTGVPIRRYRLWHRLYQSVSELPLNRNITNSALGAGFSDASHFNRTFKSMFGMTPTHLLMQPNGLVIYTDVMKRSCS